MGLMDMTTLGPLTVTEDSPHWIMKLSNSSSMVRIAMMLALSGINSLSIGFTAHIV